MKRTSIGLLLLACAGASPAQLPALTLEPLGLTGPGYTASDFVSNFSYSHAYTNFRPLVIGETFLATPRGENDDSDLWIFTLATGLVPVGGVPQDRFTARRWDPYFLPLTRSGIVVGNVGEKPTVPLLSDSRVLSEVYRSFAYIPGQGEIQLGIRSASLEPARHSSVASAVNEAGYIAGTTTVYSPEASITHSWLRSPTGQYTTGVLPTSPGRQTINLVSNDGRVMGDTYAQDDYEPQGGWTYSPATGSQYLPHLPDGRLLINPQGFGSATVATAYAAGGYREGSYLLSGQNPPIRIDNADALNLPPGQHFHASADPITHDRFIVGASHYDNANGGTETQSVWVYSPQSGTSTIGLFTGKHLSATGMHNNYVSETTERAVLGSAQSYQGDGYVTPWIWTPERGTIAIEPPQPENLPPGGRFSSYAEAHNSHLQVIGTTTIYYPSTDANYQTYEGWFFDPATDQVIPIRVPGAGATLLSGILDNGLVVGLYGAGVGGPRGTDVFLWSEQLGYVTLAGRFPELADFEFLYAFVGEDPQNTIYISAYDEQNQATATFTLAVAIPEPSLAATMLLPALLLRRPRLSAAL
jgi:hypothetical protein